MVVGAGGFGREVLDVAEQMASTGHGWDVLGVIDDAISDENLRLLSDRGYRHLGGSAALETMVPTNYVIGIGSPRVRRTLADRFDAAGHRAAILVHPSATFGSEVSLAPGSVICAGARLTTNIRGGRHLHVNLNATVGHDVSLGDFVSLNPLASISGDCVVGDDVLVGVGGIVLNGLVIGAGAIVGGAACVVRDVPSGAVVKGVPAR